VPVGGGDVGVAVQPQDADRRAAQRCHDARRVSGSDQGLVFLVGDADPVELVLYVPVAAAPGGEVGGFGLAVAGDEVDDLDGPLVLRRDGSAQLRDMGGAVEPDSGRGQRHLDRAAGAAAVVHGHGRDGEDPVRFRVHGDLAQDRADAVGEGRDQVRGLPVLAPRAPDGLGVDLDHQSAAGPRGLSPKPGAEDLSSTSGLTKANAAPERGLLRRATCLA